MLGRRSLFFSADPGLELRPVCSPPESQPRCTPLEPPGPPGKPLREASPSSHRSRSCLCRLQGPGGDWTGPQYRSLGRLKPGEEHPRDEGTAPLSLKEVRAAVTRPPATVLWTPWGLGRLHQISGKTSYNLTCPRFLASQGGQDTPCIHLTGGKPVPESEFGAANPWSLESKQPVPSSCPPRAPGTPFLRGPNPDHFRGCFGDQHSGTGREDPIPPGRLTPCLLQGLRPRRKPQLPDGKTHVNSPRQADRYPRARQKVRLFSTPLGFPKLQRNLTKLLLHGRQHSTYLRVSR